MVLGPPRGIEGISLKELKWFFEKVALGRRMRLSSKRECV
jgi:hypothetical protein